MGGQGQGRRRVRDGDPAAVRVRGASGLRPGFLIAVSLMGWEVLSTQREGERWVRGGQGASAGSHAKGTRTRAGGHDRVSRSWKD